MEIIAWVVCTSGFHSQVLESLSQTNECAKRTSEYMNDKLSKTGE